MFWYFSLILKSKQKYFRQASMHHWHECFVLNPLFPLLAGTSCIRRIFLLVRMELWVPLLWSLLYSCKYIWTYCGVWLQIIGSFVLKTVRKSKTGNVYTVVVHTLSECFVSCFTYFVSFDVHLLQVKLNFLKLTARYIWCTVRNYFSLNLVNGQSIKVRDIWCKSCKC